MGFAVIGKLTDNLYIIKEGKNSIEVKDYIAYIRSLENANPIKALSFSEIKANASKDLISKVTKSAYNKYLRKHLKINSSDILAYIIYKMIEEIGIHTLISLRKHWALFSRDLLPYLLKNKT